MRCENGRSNVCLRQIKRAKNQEQENYELIDKANNSVMLQLGNGNLF